MKRITILLMIMSVFALSLTTSAQLTGVKTIPGTYATLKVAIDDLNLLGVGPGGVTFNVAAGYTETITATLVITATGTQANPVIFQKNGSGANPLVTAFVGTATPSSATPDGIWCLAGSDYVTIDGIDLYDPNTTNPATMEYGYGLFKVGATNGAQYNTIKNCVVTLNRVNNASSTSPMVEGSVGILVINATRTTATTAITPTDASGTNSYNMFYTNTIQNSNYGIVLSGYAASTPFTLGDTGNDVGGTGLTTGNTILNYGGAASATNPAAGIRANNQWGVNISYNTINNNNGSGVNHVSTLRGIYAQAGTSANATINNNTITVKGGGTTSQLAAIENVIGSTAASNTVAIKNNVITNCSYSTATSGVFYGIYNTASAANLNIDGNNINNCTIAGTGTWYGISLGSPVTATMNNNNINNISRTGIGTIYALQITTPTTVTANGNTVELINQNATASTGSTYGFYSLSSAVTVNVNNNIFRNFTCTGAGSLYGIREYSVAGNKTIQNNQIYSFSTVGGSCYGIYVTVGTIDLSNNNIYSLNCTGGTAGAVYGIYVSGGTAINTYKNKVYDLSLASAGPTLYGIYIAGGTTNYVYNNFVSDLRTPAANAAIPIAGIYISGGTTSNVFYNTVYLTGTSTGALFGSAAIYASTTPTLDLRNNVLVNMTTPAGATGFATAFRRSSSTLTTYSNNSNANCFYAGTPGTNRLIMYDGTNSYQTMAAYQTAVGPTRDAISFSELPPFVNVASTPYDIHIKTDVATMCESGGLNITSPIAVTDDIDSNPRASNPDVGADEFPGLPAGIINPSGFTATTISSQQIRLTFTPNAANNNVVIVWGLTAAFTAPTGTPPAVGEPFAGGTLLYNGTVSPVNHTGLTPGTTYYYKAFSYNGTSTYSFGVSASAVPSVAPPTAFTATAISASQINLAYSLNAQGNNAVIATNSTSTFGTPVNGTPLNVNDPIAGGGTVIYVGPLAAFEHTNLSAQTTYYYKVWSYDAFNFYSATGATANAMTFCVIADIPFIENFDSYTVPSVGCGTVLDVNADGVLWKTTTTSTYNGLNKLSISYSAAGVTMNDWYITKGINLIGGTSYDVKFWYRAVASSYVERLEVKWGTAPTVAGMTSPAIFTKTDFTNTTYTLGYATFTPATSGVYFVGWHCFSIGDQDGIYVDAISIEETPLCTAPLTVTAVPLSSTSISAGWTGTPTNVQFDYGTVGHVAGTGTNTGTVSANPSTISGLTANTSYDVFVRQDCGSGMYSPWTGPVTVTTLCDAVSAFSENFDAVTTPALPTCWNKFSSYSTGTVTTISSTSNSSPNCAQLYNSGATSTDNILLISPQLTNLEAGTHQLSFYAKSSSTLVTTVIVGTMTNPAVGSTFTPFQTVTINSTSFTKCEISFEPYVGTNTYIAFRHPSNSTYSNVYIDNVVWQPIPLCPSPTSLTATAITTTSAVLGWTSSASIFDIELGLSGFTPTGTPTYASVSNPYTVSSLNASTSYSFYVRANCDSYGNSYWTGPFTFTTLCGTATVPFVENFDSYTVPSVGCGTVIDVNGDGVKWVTATGTPYNGLNKLRIGYSASGVTMNDWYFTQGVALTGGVSYDVKFYYKGGSTTYVESLEVKWGDAPTVAGMTSGAIFSDVSFYKAAYTLGSASFTPATTGTYYVGWHCYSIPNQINIDIDQITITATPVDPIFTFVPTSVACGYGIVGGYSAEKTYTIAGANLTGAPGNIIVTAPANFQVSLTTGTGFGSTVNVPYSTATLAATTVYVRCAPTAPNTYYSGDITHAGGGTTGNVPVTGNSDLFTNYCASGATSTSDEEIYSVTVNGITNAYNCTTVAPGAGSILNRYSNFYPLGLIFSMNQGSSASFIVEENECDGATYYAFGTAIWIDFNQDGDFLDANEKVFVETSTLIGPRNVTGFINVPADALVGVTAMRVTVAENLSGTGLTPCLSYSYGETEDYKIQINPGTFGSLNGYVYKAGTTTPISGATVSFASYSATTNASGYYNFPNVSEGTYNVTASAPDYVSQTINGIIITVGNVTSQNFELGFAQISVNPSSYAETLGPNEIRTKTLTISNANGTVPLTYSASVNLLTDDGTSTYAEPGIIKERSTENQNAEISPRYMSGGSVTDAVGDVLMDIDVQTPATNHALLLGCEFDGTYIWTTGGGASVSTDANYLFKYSKTGTLIASYPQITAASGYGLRDMAYVPATNLLYAGDETGLYSINPATGAQTQVFTGTITGTGSVIRGLAYDPTNNSFWTKNFDYSLVNFQVTSPTTVTILGTYTVSESLATYGIAYDPNPAGPFLWLFDQSGTPTTKFIQWNITTHASTGVTIQVPMLTGLTDQTAGGAGYDFGALVPGKITLFGLAQGTLLDRFFAVELGNSQTWLSITSNASGTVPPGGSIDLSLKFDATGLEDITKTATISLTSNGIPSSRSTFSVPVTMVVAPYTTAPAPATQPNPSNGATNVHSQPILSWTNGAGTTEVLVTIFKEVNEEQVTVLASHWFVGNSLNLATYLPSTTLEANKLHTWKVTSRNTAGSINSATWSFTTIGQGTISGIVTDGNGKTGISGVTITASELRYTAITGADGTYHIPNVNVGSYTVTATHPDYSPAAPIVVNVANSMTATANFVLSPLCLPPTALTVTNITATSADPGWTSTASAWNIEYGPAGFTQGTGTLISNVNTNPYHLTGLVPATNYSFYVQSVCAGSNASTWAGPKAFTTACVAVSVPYIQNFDGVVAPAIPNCMTVTNDNGDANTWATFATTPNSAPNSMSILYNSTFAMDDWFFTPALILEAGKTYIVQFYYKAYSASYPEKLEVKWGTSASASGMTGGIVYNNANIVNTTYALATGTFSPVTSGEYFVGWHGYSALNMWRLYVDDISVIQQPTCPAPLTLIATGITKNSAQLGWTAGGTETLWDIEWGPAGFTQGTGTLISGVTTNPYTLNGLTPATNYAFYVRANCGGGDLSAWSGPKTFTTAVSCPAPTLLTVTGITQTSAILGWTAGGTETSWNIEWGPAGFTQGTGTMISAVMANPYTLNGLTASTSYAFYVQADCSGGDMSVWAGPKTFTTLCSAFSLPFAENFTGTTVGSIPNCWSTQGLGLTNWSVQATTNAGGTSPEMRFYFSPSFTGLSLLTSPVINTSGKTKLQLSFKHFVDYYAAGIYVGVKTTSDGTNWNNVWEISPTANVGPATVDLTIENADVGSPTFQFAFYFSGNSYNIDYWYVDNVSLVGIAQPQQTVTLPLGWSGWSSYIAPDAKATFAGVVAPITADMAITQYFSNVFWPEYGINTMGDFSNAHGYVTKMNAESALTLVGTVAESTISLNAGWNIIPVISTCNVAASELENIAGFIIAVEIAGNGVYYPAGEIYTLTQLVPGKAYYVKTSTASMFTFPACGADGGYTNIKPVRNQNITNWNDVNYTGVSHTVVFDQNATSQLAQGDVIGAFTSNGLCAGMVMVDGNTTAMSLFANDISTTEVDGFADGEMISFRVYRQSTGEEFTLDVTYNAQMPNSNGLYAVNGLSVVNNLTMSITGINGQSLSGLSIYPNPSNGVFTISLNGLDKNIDYVIMNAHGQQVVEGKLLNTLQIDLTAQPKGVYFIKFTSNSVLRIEKVVVK